jgi:DNA polymerase III delta prime subunit
MTCIPYGLEWNTESVGKWLKDYYTSKKPQPFFYLAGFAGTGKSTIARYFADNINGEVSYAAYTGKASLVMRNNGCIGAKTIHSSIYIAEQNKKTGEIRWHLNKINSPYNDSKLIVIDECSMVDEDLAKDVLEIITVFSARLYGARSKKNKKLIEDMQKNGQLVIEALAYIRGRSLSDTFFIIDEAQNLTPHEIKTIITRAGEGTKMVFTGDIQQIDQPYLDSQSNGLVYMIDRMKDQNIFAHVNLLKGERSELSELASNLL